MRKPLHLLLAATLIACATHTAAELGKPFELKVGTEAQLAPGVSLQFLEVTGDSRCPASVQCIQAGEATVRVQLSVSGQGRLLELSTNPTPPHPSETSALGYRVKLLDVAPYPATPGRIDPMRYSARLQVDKL